MNNVGTVSDTGVVADLFKNFNKPSEVLGKFFEYRTAFVDCARGPYGLGQAAIGSATHGDIVVHVYHSPFQAIRKQPRDEQGDVTKPAQGMLTMFRSSSLNGLSK
jgi:hypothetical protein